MTYAVETKKRKFHRVLESLSKASNATSSSKRTTASSATSAELAPSAKRARLSGRDDSDIESVRKAIIRASRPISRASSVSSQSRPSFVPWDRERFLERLETFRQVNRWSPKPSAVDEVVWAKRGWICTDVDRVKCVGGCEGAVVVKIPDELDELDGYDSEKIRESKETRAKVVQEYVSLVVQGHAESCPWRNQGCDATIHRLPLANPETAVSGLESRYANLLQLADQLPDPADIQVPEAFNAEEMIRVLPPENLRTSEVHVETTEAQAPASDNNQELEYQHTSQAEPRINKAAFILAIFGWDSVVDATAGMARCGACFRRLGLWKYKLKDGGEDPDHDPLDVVNEHMDYCPWINGSVQSGTGKAPEKAAGLHNGWESLVQALKVKHRRQARSSVTMGSRAGSEAPSADSAVVDGVNDETKKTKDREWWAKVRRIRQILNVSSPKRKLSTTQ